MHFSTSASQHLRVIMKHFTLIPIIPWVYLFMFPKVIVNRKFHFIFLRDMLQWIFLNGCYFTVNHLQNDITLQTGIILMNFRFFKAQVVSKNHSLKRFLKMCYTFWRRNCPCDKICEKDFDHKIKSKGNCPKLGELTEFSSKPQKPRLIIISGVLSS